LPDGEPRHERVEDPEPPAIVVEDKLHTRLVELVVAESVTVAVNPLTGLTVMVEMPVTPALTLTLDGAVEIVKSAVLGTVTLTKTNSSLGPLVTVTLTV